MQDGYVHLPADEPENSALESIRLILKEMLKVIKAVSLYPESNPLPQSLKRTFAEHLELLVAGHGRISLEVEKDRLTWNGKTVFTDQSKEESLAGIFFNAGISGIVFEVGLEVNEIYELLGILKKYINAPRYGYDLVAGLWEKSLTHFTVTTVEDTALGEYEGDFRIQEFGDIDEPTLTDKYADIGRTEAYQSVFICEGPLSDGPHDAENRSPLENSTLADDDTQEDSLRLSEASEAMGYGDVSPFDAAPESASPPYTRLELSQASEEEETRVRDMVAEEGEFDVYESTAELAKEMLHQETDLQAFGETVGIVEKTVTELVQHAELVNAGMLIHYMSSLEEQIRGEKPLWSERLKETRIAVGSRDQFQVLADALNRNPELEADQLRRYLENFGWEALAGVTEMLGSLKHDSHSRAVSDFLVTHGKNHIQTLSRGIYDKRSHVVRNAITVLSRIGGSEVLPHLEKTLRHRDRQVRLRLVRSLQDIPHNDALSILRRAAGDPDFEVRREAVNSIVSRRGRAAFETIADMVGDSAFKSLDHDERQMLLVAYSVLGGEHALDYLNRLIAQPNLFRNETLTSLREAAFVALAHNRSKKSERLLLSLRDSRRPHIKRLAAEAIRLRRELS
jgi:hypothetical protein